MFFCALQKLPPQCPCLYNLQWVAKHRIWKWEEYKRVEYHAGSLRRVMTVLRTGQRVSFVPSPRRREVLHDISFTAMPGQTLALVRREKQLCHHKCFFSVALHTLLHLVQSKAVMALHSKSLQDWQVAGTSS